jgi:hypothetical protein
MIYIIFCWRGIENIPPFEVPNPYPILILVKLYRKAGKAWGSDKVTDKMLSIVFTVFNQNF